MVLIWRTPSVASTILIFLFLAHTTTTPTLAGKLAMKNLNAATQQNSEQDIDIDAKKANFKIDEIKNEANDPALMTSPNNPLRVLLEKSKVRVKRQDSANQIPPEKKDTVDLDCKEGLLVPIWHPQFNLQLGEQLARGLAYFLLMVYLFVGVSIVSDRFMGAIEMITSTERKVKIKRKSGIVDVVKVRIWNETVANLTLMALGSSAPEILLSIIEIYGNHFEEGELGPGTIVGSAAFNLFVIIGICMIVIPDGEVRRIKHLRVFIVTASFSVFAYIWLYLILAQISPGIIEIWEGLVTLLLFPVLVLWAYIAERRLLVYKFISKNYRVNKRGVIVTGERSNIHLENEQSVTMKGFHTEESDTDLREFDQARREYIEILVALRKKYPETDMTTLEMLAQEELINRGPKSRAFYRIQATRQMIGSSNIVRKIQERAHNDMIEVKAELQQRDSDESTSEAPIRVFFEPGHYTVMEGCGEFEVRVVRRGDISGYTMIDFATEDGSAEAGSDYVGKQGTLTFPPGVDEQRFKIEIIDDDVFEEDECFYIRLSNPSEPAEISVPRVATVMILDDDHCGIFGFETETIDIPESVGTFKLVVHRFSGSRGKIIVPFFIEEGTAKPGKDYEDVRGEIIFEDEDHEKEIEIPILEESSYEKNVTFYVQIGQPYISPDDELAAIIHDAESKNPNLLTAEEKMMLSGRPRLGATARIAVHITESEDFRRTVDQLVKKANAASVIGTSSWKEQFRDALTVIPVDETEFDGDDDVETVPSCTDYIMHFFTLFWKICFAIIPPSGIYGGYPCFFTSIVFIGIVTAIIGDIAAHFGCTLGIKDSVTAICIVALGTSIPDTFASKIAALNDKTADNSIGNVTGSNAVNVFLGIGIAWLTAAVYHSTQGSYFRVTPGTIGFAVAIFCLEAILGIGLMLFRRIPKIGGELGGNKTCKWFSGVFMITLWVIYIIISTLEAYDLINPF